jgi:mannose-6-phosphate isomerase-like protein (cupin superfamily)
VVVSGEAGEVADLGVIQMRLLCAEADTRGAFGLAEFRGGEGPWTVPHVHERMEESFYVVRGSFTFTMGEHEVETSQGAFVMIPRGTPHLIRASQEGSVLLAIFTPAGLERMFLELSRLPANSITDPRTRAEFAHRHDSVPVEASAHQTT